MKKLFILILVIISMHCVTDPVLDDPKMLFFANKSVSLYLPLYIYIDSSNVGKLTDTIKPFIGKIPDKNDNALLKVDITPGKHTITVLSLPDLQSNVINYSNLKNIENDLVVQSGFHSSISIEIEMGQHIFQGIGN